MTRKRIRSRHRDLASLLEVTRGPDANRLTAAATTAPIASERPVGCASHSTTTLEMKPRVTRSRAIRRSSVIDGLVSARC